MNRILFAIIRKEVTHVVRDPLSLAIILIMPLLQLFLYGYAITLDMKRIETAIVDESRTPESRELIARAASTEFFHVSARDVPVDKISDLFKERAARCALVIPEDYARKLTAGQEAKVALIVDASDPNAASFINGYLSQIVVQQNVSAGGAAARFALSPRIFYNPDMRSADYLIPGLIAFILSLITAVLTSIAIVREKETGTLEQILVSPIRPWQLIIGKLIPYIMIAFLDGSLILAAGSLWFRVPIKGSLLLVQAMMLIYAVTGLSIGVLVSTRAKTQAVALQTANAITNLPSMLLSGFIFPVSSMPKIFQYLSRVVPPTYFIQIIRGIILKGNTIANLYPQAIVLLGMAALLITISIRSFKIRLD